MKKTNIGLLLAIVISTGIGSAYGQGTNNVDNTSINRRDRHDANPTAEDQSNDKRDIDISARLRRKIVACKGLSTDAQNVKIINQGGCVTLRGPVENIREKEIIGNLAKQCCGENYKNELEVEKQR